MRKLGIKDEQEALRELGITPIPGSGNGIDKEDGRNGHCLVQRKATRNHKSITIFYRDLIDLIHHAEQAGHKVPLFIFQIQDLQFLCVSDLYLDRGVDVFQELQESVRRVG